MSLNNAYGGELKQLIVADDIAVNLKAEANTLFDITLSPRQLCDIEMLMDGSFSPLSGFMTQEQYTGVVEDMRLPSGTLFPIPITLDISSQQADQIATNDRVALRDPEGILLAVMDVESKFEPDFNQQALQVFGTNDVKHPAVDYLFNQSGKVYIGGAISGVNLPVHYDFTQLRSTPSELRQTLNAAGVDKLVAFQTRNPMHRAHVELTLKAAKEVNAALLIHPVVGMTKPGDIDHYSRVRCYQQIMPYLPDNSYLSLLPLAMRMGGPREAVLHAIIRRNYGCTHLIVGRDHAGPGKDSNGNDFYGPYDAQQIITEHETELGIIMVPFQLMVYVPEIKEYKVIDQVEAGMTTKNISGTQFRDMLQTSQDIPEWFSYREVVEELRKTYPGKNKQGFVVFFTGLSGSGKSTIANSLIVKLMEIGGRYVGLLDGDHVRQHLSSELGFSAEHRNLNITRIGYVASQIAAAGGAAICAPIAPYTQTRRAVRSLVSQNSGFIEIYVNTPIEVCEQRDRKGLYEKARQGIIKNFTGIDDPYEAPENAEISIDTSNISVDEAAQLIIDFLAKQGYFSA